jgi:branched-chain amino acid transport system permease protein
MSAEVPRRSGQAARAAETTLRGDRFRRWEAAVWLVPVLGYFVFPEYLVLGRQMLIAGLFVLSLDLLLGYAGIVSLGHATFFGVGAYTAGLLAAHGWGEPVSGLCLAAAVAGVLGHLVSFLVVGGQGLTRLMVTLGVGFLFHEAANQASSVTGGTDGLSGMIMWKLLGLWKFDLLGKVAYLYALLVLFLAFMLARRVVASPFGLSLEGIRENERRMPAIGVPVRQRLTWMFTLAAALAGVAGGLAAQTTEFVGLEVLSFERSASALIMLVLGGTGRLYGALAGTCAFMLLQSFFSDLDPAYWQFWLGLLVVLIAFFARGGVLGGAARLSASLRARARERAAAGSRS